MGFHFFAIWELLSYGLEFNLELNYTAVSQSKSYSCKLLSTKKAKTLLFRAAVRISFLNYKHNENK